MSKINSIYGTGDIKYYWNIHKQRMHQLGEPAVCYSVFRARLNSGMDLKTAIYTPSNEYLNHYRKIREKENRRADERKAVLIDNEIQHGTERLDHVTRKAETNTRVFVYKREKRTPRQKFISLFK